MWWDQISSFWNHLLKSELAVDRKFSHSLRVYCRSGSATAQKGRDTLRWASISTQASNKKVNCLSLEECDQSARALMRQATSRTYHNASGPVACLTIHNPLLALSVTSSLACHGSVYPNLWVDSDEQLLELRHYNAQLFHSGVTNHLRLRVCLFHIILLGLLWAQPQ